VKTKLAVLALSSGLTLVGCGAEQGTAAESHSETMVDTTPLALDTVEQKISYLMGYSNVAGATHQGVIIDKEAYIKGTTESLDGLDSAISEEDAQSVIAEFQKKLQAEAQAQHASAGAENEAKSAAFLAENAKKEGVVTTESGLQYKVLEAGKGDKPSAESTVQVHYEGRLINGQIFDSSLERGAPVEFALNQVIPGWTEALQLMPEGSHYELYIPGDLAYGPTGSRSIGPNEALIFKVQLLQANFEPESAEK